MLVRIRDTEACAPVSNFIWDSVWWNRPEDAGGYADWILAGSDDPAEQRGGLRARMQLMTAILIQVFTDKRLPQGMRAPGDGADPRGWWGDSFKLDGEPEGETGSLLWTLQRGTLTAGTAKLARQYVEQSLETILVQGAVARFEVTAEANPAVGFLSISIAAFDRVGRPITQAFVFDVVWQQLHAPAPMNYAVR